MASSVATATGLVLATCLPFCRRVMSLQFDAAVDAASLSDLGLNWTRRIKRVVPRNVQTGKIK